MVFNMENIKKFFKIPLFSRRFTIILFVLCVSANILYRLATSVQMPFLLCVVGVCVEAFLFFRVQDTLSEKKSPAVYAAVPLCLFVFAVVYFAQAYSIRQTGEYISILALENTRHFSLLMTEKLKRKIFEAFALFLVFCILFSLSQIPNKKINFFKIQTVCLLLFFGQFFFIGRLPALSPFADFAVKIEHLLFPKKLTFFDPSRTKEIVYKSDFPYKRINAPKKPNVFIFFTEGLSARLIGTYNPRFKKLTPRIDEFAERALKVTNYYNHTAATEKGILGSLASIYIDFHLRGRTKTNMNMLSALPLLMRRSGYETVFMASTIKSSKTLLDILNRLHFDQVVSTKELRENILKKNDDGSFPRDEEFFNGIIKYFENRSAKKPVFAAFYNLETHAFTDTAPDGVKIGDGKNSVLNTTANYDVQFGKFFNWFKKSKYAENSILILTADHSHFYETPYLSLMSEEKNHKPFFVDSIPLLIYAPFIKQPKTLNAKGRNSLVLAPTVLHYLGIKNITNSFFGSSLFDPPSEKMNLSEISHTFFVTDGNGVRHETELDENELEDYIKAKNSLVFIPYSATE